MPGSSSHYFLKHTVLKGPTQFKLMHSLAFNKSPVSEKNTSPHGHLRIPINTNTHKLFKCQTNEQFGFQRFLMWLIFTIFIWYLCGNMFSLDHQNRTHVEFGFHQITIVGKYFCPILRLWSCWLQHKMYNL